MFWQKEKVRSEEYETLLKKMAELRLYCETIGAKLEALNTNYDNLRGQFNRKLAFIRKEGIDPDAQPAKPQETKDLNTKEPRVFTGMQLYGNN